MQRSKRLRFNKEEFGYLVGFPDGKIILTKASAQSLLERGAEYSEIAEHKLETIEVREGFYLSTPPLVWLEITKACNLTCPHCYIDGGERRENELSSAEIHRLIDDMADMGVWAVAFTGGEPTLHPDFVDFVLHARRRDLLVGIATHGLGLTEALLSRLPADGVIISVSIDDLHVKGKNPDSEFAIAQKALLRCKAHGIPANIMTNTNRKNVGRLEKIIAWGEENGISVRSVPFSPIGTRAKQHAAELENTVDDVNIAAKFWLKEVMWEHKYHEEVGLCVGVIFNYGLTLAYLTRRCSSARFLCYIASDGTMYPCTMCAGETIFAHGTLRETPFAELWRSDWSIRQLSWDNFKATCSECPLDSEDYYCSSRCPAMSHARHNDLNSCGASAFEKVSLVVRTSLMQNSDLRENLDQVAYSGPQHF